MKTKPTIRSPQAAALASSLFRKRVKPSGKGYSRKGYRPDVAAHNRLHNGIKGDPRNQTRES